jgi:hypothetical protein
MTISNHPVEQEEIMAYLDGELPPERAAETAYHLERCAQCKQLAGDLQEISKQMMMWQIEEAELEPAKDLDLDKTREKPASRRIAAMQQGSWLSLLNPRRWPKPVWALATVAVIAVVVVTPNVLRRQSVSPMMPFSGRLRVRQNSSAPIKPPLSTDSYADGHLGLLSRGTLGKLSPVPPATAQSGTGSLGKFETNQTEDDIDVGNQEISNAPGSNGPMIIRTAELQVTTKEFDKARLSLEEILRRHHGYIGELNVNTATGSARSLIGALRVPASQLDATLTDLKGLGRTEKESQGGEEVTQQYVDLEARLANAKHTEQRLADMLRERTGKLSDVLAVEMQISRVRSEIEQMEAQRKSMKNQVDFASVTITVAEEYKAEINAMPPSISTQFRNAAIAGYTSLVDGVIAVLLWLLSAGPTLLAWIAILFFPAKILWKKITPKFAQNVEQV